MRLSYRRHCHSSIFDEAYFLPSGAMQCIIQPMPWRCVVCPSVTFVYCIKMSKLNSLTHSLTAALDQLRVVASSTSNDPGPRSRQHQQIGQHLVVSFYQQGTAERNIKNRRTNTCLNYGFNKALG